MLKVAWDPKYILPLPKGHRFPMEKYELLPQQLLYEGTLSEDNFFTPQPCKEQDILGVHAKAYLQDLIELNLSKLDIRRSGFPLTEKLIEREILIAGGTVACSDYAREYGIAFNIAGGTHHAFSDRPEGFCLLNDQAIAANRLLQNGLAKNILIVDLDVHQGNGTAKIFADNSNVFTFSMHGMKNYPLKKERSDLDVGLDDGIEDGEYLKKLAVNIKDILQKFQPDFVFYQAGVDVLSTDKLGRLGLSLQGCSERDEMVFSTFRALDIPLVVCMGGGYSPKIGQIVDAHANTYRIASIYL